MWQRDEQVLWCPRSCHSRTELKKMLGSFPSWGHSDLCEDNGVECGEAALFGLRAMGNGGQRKLWGGGQRVMINWCPDVGEQTWSLCQHWEPARGNLVWAGSIQHWCQETHPIS